MNRTPSRPSQSEQATTMHTTSDEVRTQLIYEVDLARYELAVSDGNVSQEDRDAARQVADRARTTMVQTIEALARHDARVFETCDAFGHVVDTATSWCSSPAPTHERANADD